MNHEQLTDEQLNNEVAEKVMGLTAKIVNCWSGSIELFYTAYQRNGQTIYADDPLMEYDQLPLYSTSIAQAFEVVERFNGYEIIKSTTEPTLKYRVRLWFDSQGKTTGFIWDKSLPRAICIASLKAVEAKEGKE
jgi:hypothetical protein